MRNKIFVQQKYIGFHILVYMNYIIGLFAVFVYFISAGFILFKIIFESNHIGFSLFNFIPHILVLAVIGLTNIIFPFKNRNLGILILCLSVLVVCCIFLFDHYNILLEYHDWIRRGMPSKPWASFKILGFN